MDKIKSLTKAEEQIMLILWKIKKGFVKDIIKQISGKKPAYTTISTIIRILEKKGFVKHIAYGPSHQYYPSIQKVEYRATYVQDLLKNYFNNSFSKLVHFYSKKDNIDISELDNTLKMLEDLKNKKKRDK